MMQKQRSYSLNLNTSPASRLKAKVFEISRNKN